MKATIKGKLKSIKAEKSQRNYEKSRKYSKKIEKMIDNNITLWYYSAVRK